MGTPSTPAIGPNRRILLLVGPKGAGKTYLGVRAEAELGIPFVRVEPLWLALREEGGWAGAQFDEEGQRRVVDAVQAALRSHPAVVLESTGTAAWFPRFLSRLNGLGRVILIRVTAPAPLCLERIRTRDATVHIPVSDDRAVRINDAAVRVSLPWSATIDNQTPADADRFLDELRRWEAGV